jgi:hypothetical protein
MRRSAPGSPVHSAPRQTAAPIGCRSIRHRPRDSSRGRDPPSPWTGAHSVGWLRLVWMRSSPFSRRGSGPGWRPRLPTTPGNRSRHAPGMPRRLHVGFIIPSRPPPFQDGLPKFFPRFKRRGVGRRKAESDDASRRRPHSSAAPSARPGPDRSRAAGVLAGKGWAIEDWRRRLAHSIRHGAETLGLHVEDAGALIALDTAAPPFPPRGGITLPTDMPIFSRENT